MLFIPVCKVWARSLQDPATHTIVDVTCNQDAYTPTCSQEGEAGRWGMQVGGKEEEERLEGLTGNLQAEEQADCTVLSVSTRRQGALPQVRTDVKHYATICAVCLSLLCVGWLRGGMRDILLAVRARQTFVSSYGVGLWRHPSSRFILGHAVELCTLTWSP